MFQNIISNVFTHKITDTVPNHKTFYEEQKLPKHYFLQFKISKMSPECEMGSKAMRYALKSKIFFSLGEAKHNDF